jgi:hypothetical protein
MDGNIYQGPSNTGYPPYAPERNINPDYDSEQQALNRLMDSVHKSRIEDVHIGQDTVEMRLEDAHVVQGAIEIRARIIPKLDGYTEKREQIGYLVPAPSYQPPVCSYPYPNQFYPQYPYQYPNQVPLQYSYHYPYQYLNHPPVQYPYPSQYPSQFPVRYFNQYPLANAAGSIANAISQLVFTANLLRR